MIGLLCRMMVGDRVPMQECRVMELLCRLNDGVPIQNDGVPINGNIACRSLPLKGKA